MRLGNRDFDLADQMAEAERSSAIFAAQRALSGAGALDCIDCGLEIPEARRKATPSAKRCIVCQTCVERGES